MQKIGVKKQWCEFAQFSDIKFLVEKNAKNGEK